MRPPGSSSGGRMNQLRALRCAETHPEHLARERRNHRSSDAVGAAKVD